MALIELKNVSKIFQMGSEVVRALDDVTTQIDEGEFVAMMGAEGIRELLRGIDIEKQIEQIRAELQATGSEAKIKKFAGEGKKTAVISTINGDSNVPFYKELGNQGLKATDVPVVAFSVGEEELRGVDTKPLVGHLAAWNYFMSIKAPANDEFKKKWAAYAKAKKLPDADIRAANSPAEAAREVSRSKRAGLAAIANRAAVRSYGLRSLATRIEDHEHNQTRFVLLGRGIPAPTGHDRTSIVCFQRADRPGSLLAILQEFAARTINLTKVESRPTKHSLGDYCFFIDFVGHVGEPIVADCLRTIAASAAQVKFLGSYPVAGEAASQRRRSAGRAWRDAEAWMAGLHDQIRTPGGDA